MTFGLAAGAQRRTPNAARELVQNLGRGGAARIGLRVEDVVADREPGDDAAQRRQSGTRHRGDHEAVGHLGRVVEGVSRQAGDHREHGDGEQAADARDSVVDPRGNARVAGVCRGQDGGGHGSDHEREAQAEDDYRRQDVGHVAVARVDLREPDEARRDHERADGEGDSGSDPLCQSARAR
jgi:hypothetical protein